MADWGQVGSGVDPIVPSDGPTATRQEIANDSQSQALRSKP